MQQADQRGDPVRAKAVLVDPASMAVLWMNESAAQATATSPGSSDVAITLERAVPMAGTLGVSEAVRAVAETGVTRHLQAGLVSTARGRMALVISIDRLPDGTVLIVEERAWQFAGGAPDGAPRRSRGRPKR